MGKADRIFKLSRMAWFNIVLSSCFTILHAITGSNPSIKLVLPVTLNGLENSFTDPFHIRKSVTNSGRCIVSFSETDSLTLLNLNRKLELLEKTVSLAKLKGINTVYEDITISTASLFIKNFIPWDMSHPAELEVAFSGWSNKKDLKGTPLAEAKRIPVWEINQTSDILEKAQVKLENVIHRPESRRAVPDINVDNFKIENGFLNSDDRPVFSGGFIWAPVDMDRKYFGLIGGEVWVPFNTLKIDGSINENTLNGIINKLDILSEKGQKGSISFGQSIAPWIVAKWPDIDDYAGHFFSYDIDHPRVKGLWKDFIASLIPRVCDHPALFDYQLAIEPIWPSIGNWMVNNASPYTFQKYRDWLKGKCLNINNLNDSWGTNLDDFTEITSRPKDNSNKASWYDWCIFNEWRVTDFFMYIKGEIKKHDPDAFCHIRISVGGISEGITRNTTYTGLHNGIDRETLVRNMEINGLDNFMEDASGRTSYSRPGI